MATLALGACDAGFDGTPDANQPPDTELSIRVGDLTETLDGRRLVSTVELAWSGTDPDGVVTAFEVRAYPVGGAMPAPEEGWNRTTRRDSTLLLPIPQGNAQADVAVEVRAYDEEGAVDPEPARTVFPIVNSPPSFRLVDAEAPADTTWPVVSFAFAAADRDGEANLAGIEIALNDTTAGFVRLPSDATFVTLVAQNPRAASETAAEVYLGRGFQNIGQTLPGLRLDAENTVYFRSVDQAGAQSPLSTFPARDDEGVPVSSFYVRRVTSRVLLVNDYRAAGEANVLGVAEAGLAAHGLTTYDEWDLSETPQNAAAPQFSDALPATVDPTLRETLALWDRIFWVSNAVTNRASGNNLPRAASAMSAFFDGGGRLLVYTPISFPLTADQETANAAIDILPLSDLVEYPAGVRSLIARDGTPVVPVEEVPGTGRTLPPLQFTRFTTATIPYVPRPDDIVLYRTPVTIDVPPFDPFAGSTVVASMRSDRRTALVALPLFAGPNPLLAPADGSTEGVAEAFAVLLEGLEFPTGVGRLARR